MSQPQAESITDLSSHRSTVGTQVFIALGIMYFVWGATYVGIAFAIRTMPPLVSMVLRFGVASLLMLGFLAIKNGASSLQLTRVQLRNCFFLGAIMPGAGLGILTIAEHYVPIGIASLLVSALPFWIALLRTLQGDRPSVITWAGIVLGFAGVALLLAPGNVQPRPGQTSSSLLFWMILIIIGNISWAIGSFISRTMNLPANGFVTSAYEMLGAALVLIPIALIRGESFGALAHASLESWLGWAYLVVFGSLVGYTTFGWLINNAPMSLASTYAYVNPVVAMVLAMLLLGEKLTHTIALGGVIVLVGVALVVTVESRVKTKQQMALPE